MFVVHFWFKVIKQGTDGGKGESYTLPVDSAEALFNGILDSNYHMISGIPMTATEGIHYGELIDETTESTVVTETTNEDQLVIKIILES